MSEEQTRREFGEWMKIVNAPERDEPVRMVMENLVGAGLRAGIELRCGDGRITLVHRLVLLVIGRG